MQLRESDKSKSEHPDSKLPVPHEGDGRFAHLVARLYSNLLRKWTTNRIGPCALRNRDVAVSRKE